VSDWRSASTLNAGVSFVDTNVPIYAAGKPHSLKAPGSEVLELIARQPDAFVTDAEVLQELVHRYVSLKLWPDPGLTVVESFGVLMRGRVERVGARDVLTAARSATDFPRLSARDLLHLAVARRVGSDAIVTADRDFDKLPVIERLDPGDVSGWRGRVLVE
jgi:predicted nucleic acid-binding protein